MSPTLAELAALKHQKLVRRYIVLQNHIPGLWDMGNLACINGIQTHQYSRPDNCVEGDVVFPHEVDVTWAFSFFWNQPPILPSINSI